MDDLDFALRMCVGGEAIPVGRRMHRFAFTLKPIRVQISGVSTIQRFVLPIHLDKRMRLSGPVGARGDREKHVAEDLSVVVNRELASAFGVDVVSL